METADTGIGSLETGDTPDTGDFYAPGDARIPKVLGSKRKKKIKRSFMEWVREAYFIDNANGYVYIHRDGSFNPVTDSHTDTMVKLFPEILETMKEKIKDFHITDDYESLVDYISEFIHLKNIWFLVGDISNGILYVRPHGLRVPGNAVMRNIRDFSIENGFDKVKIDNAYA